MSRQADLRTAKSARAGSAGSELREPSLSPSAWAVLRRRYLRRDGSGQIVETPEQLFRRVAHAVAAADAGYGAPIERVAEIGDRFYRRMAGLEFLPNSPTLMNAGR